MSRVGRGDQSRRLDPVELAHVDVHQHEVGRASSPLAATASSPDVDLGDELEAGDPVDHRPRGGAERRLIVDDHDGHSVGHGAVILRQPVSHDPGAVDERATTRRGCGSPPPPPGTPAPP